MTTFTLQDTANMIANGGRITRLCGQYAQIVLQHNELKRQIKNHETNPDTTPMSYYEYQHNNRELIRMQDYLKSLADRLTYEGITLNGLPTLNIN